MSHQPLDREGQTLRLMAVVAHPDDESLAIGGTLAKYANEGVETHVVVATRGQRGRHRAAPFGSPEHPGRSALGLIREAELRRAAGTLGVTGIHVLDYQDGQLAEADSGEATAAIADRIRAVRPHVVVTFDPYGSYGHPDHIAISQLTTAAVFQANSVGPASETRFGRRDVRRAPHQVSKLYYIAWSEPAWAAYQSAFKKLVSVVDGVERQATPWPHWSLTTLVDTSAEWETVWSAVQCHESQLAIYGPLEHLSEVHHRGLWGTQRFYRVLSVVNGGRDTESDLFQGVRAESPGARIVGGPEDVRQGDGTNEPQSMEMAS